MNDCRKENIANKRLLYREIRCTREVELLVRFPDLNFCGSRIRFAHHVKRHFENTEITFLFR